MDNIDAKTPQKEGIVLPQEDPAVKALLTIESTAVSRSSQEGRIRQIIAKVFKRGERSSVQITKDDTTVNPDEAMKAIASLPSENETPNLEHKNIEEIVLTKEEQLVVEDLKKNGTVLATALGFIKHIDLKTHPDMALILGSLVTTALTVTTGTPIPIELAAKMATAMGAAGMGWGAARRADSNNIAAQVAGVVAGAVAGAGLSNELAHLNAPPQFGPFSGLIDDAAFAAVAAARLFKGRESRTEVQPNGAKVTIEDSSMQNSTHNQSKPVGVN